VRLECCKAGRSADNESWTVVATFHLRMYRGWQTFDIPRHLDRSCVARLWKATFLSNYGNTAAVALHGIQFLVAKEESPKVSSQCHSQVISPPPIGHETFRQSLCVVATAWPPPRYQWFHNGRLLIGETSPTLEVNINSPPSQNQRDFQCIHCKHVRQVRGVPHNAFRIVCGNCETLHIYKEYKEAEKCRNTWESEVEQLEKDVSIADKEYDEARKSRDKSWQEVVHAQEEGGSRADAVLATYKAKQALMEKAGAVLADARNNINARHKDILKSSQKDPIKISHPCEGFYDCCVSNTRGGDIIRTVSSARIYLFARDPPPLRLKVKVSYIQQRRFCRRQWSKYAWAFGWFTNGEFGGEVLIKFHDGAVYDGPYVAEDYLDVKGGIPSVARHPGHWGTWVTKNGIMHEGPLVDNHFDVKCVTGPYRITTPGGEVYEGEYVDEEMHGIGEYCSADHTVYSGEWHRGQRQGFGILESADGAVYEGDFDHNVIHGDGLWRWPDGSTYVGQSKYGKREGRGLYVTKMRDAYYGTYKNNKPHGTGLFKYCDGSSYSGDFDMGLRHGLGTYEDSKGVWSIGSWRGDKKHGTFEEHTPVYIPELQESQDEIKTGRWEEGLFVEWLLPPVFPYATKQFYELFETEENEYDGVYAMLVAKKLPFLPRGVNPSNPRVAAVVRRIAMEAGELCAIDTINETTQNVQSAKMIHDKALSRLQSAQSLEKMDLCNLESQRAATNVLVRKLSLLEGNKEKLEAEVEQAYVDDRSQTRAAFLSAVKVLKGLSSTDWFILRNYNQPPPTLTTLMSAVCTLMMVKDNWKSARNLLATSVQNMQDGDEEALHCSYDCKLIYRLENEFNPYSRCDAAELMLKLSMFVIDPHFKSDSFFLRTFGKAVGPLVDVVGSAYNYILKAAELKPRVLAVTGLANNIKHTKNRIEQEREIETRFERATAEKISRANAARQDEDKTRVHLEKLEALLAEAKGLVSVYVPPRGDPDTYEELENNLNRDRTEIEVVLELMFDQLSSNLINFHTEEYICSQIEEALASMIKRGEYNYVAGKAVCRDSMRVEEAKRDILKGCVYQINECLHKSPPSTCTWISLDGQQVVSAHINEVLDKEWDAYLSRNAHDVAVSNWELAFTGEGEAAYQALLSMTNDLVTGDRKAEATLWLDSNPDQAAEMRWMLSQQFADGWPEDTARRCLQARKQILGSNYSPDMVLQAAMWQNVHSEEIREISNILCEEKASKFMTMWSSEEEAAQKVIEIRESNDVIQKSYAEAWASFHVIAMTKVEAAIAARRADMFEER
ncbi:unnamed protein product, partial [Choristocarpus tenellus]